VSIPRRTLAAGLWGGLLAGTLDAVATLILSAGVLSLANRFHLVLIDAALGALVGSALVMVFIGWSLGLERVLGHSRWLSGSHAVTVLLASPLIVYDAFALFQGAQASRIRGHRMMSVGLIVLGMVAVWIAVTGSRWLLERAEPLPGGGGQEPARKKQVMAAGLVVVAAALAANWANLRVLPRLYHWFHMSLAVLHLVLCMLAVRMFFGTARQVLGRRWSWIIGGVAPVLLVAVFLFERPIVSRSQSLRFFVSEKTQFASLFARALPPAPARSGSTSQVAAPTAPLATGPRFREADVFLITIDALRADHAGCYGYGRRVTPNLDALAARGVRFEHTYAQAPHTSFSLASVMTGKYYPTLARLSGSEAHETLPHILRRYGWKTAAFFPPAVFYIDAHKMKAFESNNFDFEYVKYEYLNAEARVSQIEEFLASENPKKLFLWLHLFEPHEPYQAHPGFDFGTTDVDRYDSEIAYSDHVVGKVISLIEKRRPNAVVILAADHGEEFGEHGGRYHGTTLFEEQVHVPLVVVAPGLTAHRVAGPSQLVDIPATVLGLLDIPIPARMRGTDLGPWLATPAAPSDRLPPAFAEVEDKRMVVLGSEKLVCDVSKDFCSLFDLASDPHEARDLADSRPARMAVLRQRLDSWLGEQARYESTLRGAAGSAEPYARAIERGRLADTSVAGELAALLVGSAPVAARREAADILAEILPARSESREALLVAANSADDAEVRNWAAVAALRAGAREMQARLRSLLAQPATDASRGLVVHVALALAESGEGVGADRLAAALDDCSADVPLCKRAIAALGKLKDPRTTKALVEHLPFVQTRPETVAALAEMVDAESIPALIGCLEHDEYVSVRAAAARALGRLGGARARQALELASRREKEDAVLVAVLASLAAHAPSKREQRGLGRR
jgi:HEAT repeat protein